MIIDTATTSEACKAECDNDTKGTTFDPIKRCAGYTFVDGGANPCKNHYIDKPFIGNGIIADGKCYSAQQDSIKRYTEKDGGCRLVEG